MKKVRFGIIGSNFIVDRFLEAAKRCDGFELCAIYSRDIDRAKQFAEKKGISYYFDNLTAFFECKEIDAVYIASPTCCHAKQSLLAMKSGKHVICEKPIASNYKEAFTMFRTAGENNVVLMEAMRPVFNPAYEVIRQEMRSIGKVRQVNLTYCQYSSRYDKFKQGIIENAFKTELSNGAIMDIGCYCIQVMILLFGAPKRILAMDIHLPDSIDGIGNIMAGYEDFLVHISYSKITNSNEPNEIQGEAGILSFEDVTNPKELKLELSKQEKEIELPKEEHDMLYEIETFLRSVDAGQADSRFEICSLETMKVIDEARRQLHIVFPADEE